LSQAIPESPHIKIVGIPLGLYQITKLLSIFEENENKETWKDPRKTYAVFHLPPQKK
jgi:hypothetical protein